MKPSTTLLTLTLSLLTACATPSLNKNAQAWEDIGKSELFQKERNTYFSRLGDRKFCWDIGIDDFLSSNSSKPDEKCVYPASKLVLQYEDGNKSVGQAFKKLKVMQITPTGFVITSPNHADDQVIYVNKVDEKDLVDGSFLDDAQNFKMYEYAGTYSYATLVGSKTVYSFRKVNKKLGEARAGLKYYDPLREFWIQNQLWDKLDEFPK